MELGVVHTVPFFDFVGCPLRRSCAYHDIIWLDKLTDSGYPKELYETVIVRIPYRGSFMVSATILGKLVVLALVRSPDKRREKPVITANLWLFSRQLMLAMTSVVTASISLPFGMLMLSFRSGKLMLALSPSYYLARKIMFLPALGRRKPRLSVCIVE